MGLSCSGRSLSAMAFLASLDQPEKPGYRCQRCGSDGSLTRWGSEHGHRRWRCLKCHSTFCETLGTIHFRSRIGRLLVGIGSILTAADMSVRALALSLGVDKMTALRYRHLLMAELSRKRLPDRLCGHAYVDETFWPLPGSARLRGRRLMACIAIGRDESGHLDLLYVGDGYPTEATLRKAWAGKLVMVTRLTHDDLPCYEDLFSSLGVPASSQDFEKSTAPGSHEAMGPMERSCSGLKWSLRKHRSLNSTWLQGYLDLYRWRLIAMAGRKMMRLAGMLRGEAPTLNSYWRYIYIPNTSQIVPIKTRNLTISVSICTLPWLINMQTI